MCKEKNKVLIIGGAGVIGYNLALYLIQLGYQVSIYSRNCNICKNSNINCIERDYFDSSSLSAAIKQHDIIIHSLSIIQPRMTNKNEDLLHITLSQLKTTFKNIGIYNKNSIFISSGGAIYGNIGEGAIKEEQTPEPCTLYGKSKLYSEQIIRKYNKKFGNKTIIIRPSNVYGSIYHSSKSIGFIDATLHNFFNNTTMTIWGDGNTIRDYVCIGDVCAVIERLISKINTVDTTYPYNISTGVGLSQNQILSIFKKSNLLPEIEFDYNYKEQIPYIVLDNNRVIDKTGISFKNFDVDSLIRYKNAYIEKVLNEK